MPAHSSLNFLTLSDRTVTPSISQGRVLLFVTMSSNVSLTEENYVFKVDLLGVKDPEISRTISCPATAKFDDFNQALQVAFKWPLPSFYRFEVTYPLAEAKGPSLEISHQRPGLAPPSGPWEESHELELGKFLKNTDYGIAEFAYIITAKDEWHHHITLKDRDKKSTRFRCVGGEGRACPDGIGGCSAWKELKAAYRTSNTSKKQKLLMSWYEEKFANRSSTGLAGEDLWKWSNYALRKNLVSIPMRVYLWGFFG